MVRKGHHGEGISQTAVTLLQHAGLKATKARMAIIHVFLHHKKPMDIRALATKLGGDAHLATLYRTAERLASAGILTRVNLGSDSAHYELHDASHHHHHAVCTNCGRVEDIELCKKNELENEALRSSKFFKTLDTHALEFFGRCVTCIKK